MTETKINKFANIEPDWVALRFQEFFKDSFHDSLGMEILKLEQGHCITCTKIQPGMSNHIGSLHGGFLCTIADTTAGFAAIPLGAGTTVTTVDAHLQFLRPTVGVKRIYAEAEAVKEGKRITFVDLKIMAEDGTVLSKGSFTFAMLDLPDKKLPVFDPNTPSNS